MNNLISRFRRDRRGSGMVTVIVCVSFILILGTVLLFTSYTGYMIKASNRRSKVNFYSAETAMDEIRAGLQQRTTEAIKDAYTATLVDYSHITELYNDPGSYNSSTDLLNPGATNSVGKLLYPTLDKYMEANFQHIFRLELLRATYRSEDNTDSSLFISTDGSNTYSVAGLRTFLSQLPSGAKLVLNPDTNGEEGVSGRFTQSADGKTITLKSVTARYTQNGYETDLSSDFVLYVPPFSYTASEYSLTNLNKLAIVADQGLTQTGGLNLSLTGDVYADHIDLNNQQLALNYKNGILICKKTLSVGNKASFVLDSASGSTSLWAGDISLGDNAVLNLNGTVNVADDLTVLGSNASVSLSGSYTGFGYLADDQTNQLAYTDAAKPNGSSAIIVNGRNTSLNMSGLDTLTLAGSGFVNTTGANAAQGSAAYFAMGQSIAARSDQLAYLAPVIALKTDSFTYTTNPYYSADGTHFPDNTAIAQIQTNIAELAKDASYSYYKNVDGVTAMRSSSTNLIYFFLTFKTADRANAFFKGYFERNGQSADYLNQYLKTFSAAKNTYARGDTYFVGSGDVKAVQLGLAGDAFSEALTAPYTTSFRNLCTKLSATALSSSETSLTPYAYLVNTSAVDALFSAENSPSEVDFTSEDGSVVGKIVKGDYTIQAGETAKVIICTGNVAVNAPFTGLILAKGTVSLAADVSNSTDVSTALQAKNDGKTMLSYLAVGSGTGGSTGDTEGSTWNLNDLVVYKNWKKS